MSVPQRPKIQHSQPPKPATPGVTQQTPRPGSLDKLPKALPVQTATKTPMRPAYPPPPKHKSGWERVGPILLASTVLLTAYIVVTSLPRQSSHSDSAATTATTKETVLGQYKQLKINCDLDKEHYGWGVKVAIAITGKMDESEGDLLLTLKNLKPPPGQEGPFKELATLNRESLIVDEGNSTFTLRAPVGENTLTLTRFKTGEVVWRSKIVVPVKTEKTAALPMKNGAPQVKTVQIDGLKMECRISSRETGAGPMPRLEVTISGDVKTEKVIEITYPSGKKDVFGIVRKEARTKDGNWQFTSEQPLSNGSHLLTLLEVNGRKVIAQERMNVINGLKKGV